MPSHLHLAHCTACTSWLIEASTPSRMPRAERFVWHKLYSSAARQGFAEKADKDLLQAVTLASIPVEQNDEALAGSLREAPPALRSAARKRRPAIRRALVAHPQTLEQFELALD